jgi:hypothetical protein
VTHVTSCPIITVTRARVCGPNRLSCHIRHGVVALRGGPNPGKEEK